MAGVALLVLDLLDLSISNLGQATTVVITAIGAFASIWWAVVYGACRIGMYKSAETQIAMQLGHAREMAELERKSREQQKTKGSN